MFANKRRAPRPAVLAGVLTAVFAGCAWLFAPAWAAEPAKARPATPAIKAKPSTTNKAPRVAMKPASTADNPFTQRQKVPSLDGGSGWINTAGPIDMKDLRGKFVLVDFWTFCCINCMHVLPTLKRVEHAYPNNVVVIGVHSAKFAGEEDSKNITDAVLRYEIEHPVINDAKHVLWDKFGVQSWPTLVLIDPEGYAIWARSGETPFEEIDQVLKKALVYYRKKGLLDEKPLRFDLAAYKAEPTPLRFPGKILADEAGERLFIADSNHNRIVVAKFDGSLIEIIGSGVIGSTNGEYAKAAFDHPQGLALVNDTLYVADTENHMLRKVDLKKRLVSTVSGTGKQAANWPGADGLEGRPLGGRFVGKPHRTALNSPWDLCVHKRDLFIAMAGPHQIWRMPLDESEIGPYAGNGREDIVDGPLLPRRPYELGFASFAQPSGLATDGTWIYVADSEGSSIRAVPLDAKLSVRTVIGTANLPQARLFTFGDRDGAGSQALLQHCLGVAWHDGQIYVADTYNNKIKVIDPAKESCRTLAGAGTPGRADEPAEFDEPTGLSAAGGKLFIADTNNHLIRTVDLKDGRVATLEIQGLKPPLESHEQPKPDFPDAVQVKVKPATLKPADGKIRLAAQLELPAGYKINPEAPMRYLVEAVGKTGPVDRKAIGKAATLAKPASSFEIPLPITESSGEDKLKISVAYYYCQNGTGGVCKAGVVAWTVPVTIAAEGDGSSVSMKHKVE